MRKRWTPLVCASLLTVSLSGCLGIGGDRGEEGQAVKAAKPKSSVEGKIKIYAEFKESFMQDFGNILIAKYPDMDLEIVGPAMSPGMDQETLRKETNKIIEEEKPDLFFGFMAFTQWLEDKRLLELEPLIRQDKFDLERMHPAVVETVRQMGGGKLYGLAHSFSSTALMYNKDLFDQYQIPYPKDGMTWDDVIALAKRFPATGEGDSRIYGFFNLAPTPYDLISRMGGLAGLHITDSEGSKVAVQTNEWKRIWNTVIDAYRAGSIYLAPENDMPAPGSTMKDSQKRDKFMIGQAAMALVQPFTLDQFASYKNSGFKTFNWEMVTEPVDAKRPGESNSFSPRDIFAIGAKSSNKQAAWEIIQYINSDTFTKVFAKTSSFRLLGNRSASREKDGRSLDVFTKLKPSSALAQTAPRADIPASFTGSYSTLARDMSKAALKGTLTVDEALSELESKGQQMLNQAKLSAASGAGGGSK
ncbi:ABC transporter substrate-binding protein [Paenibacillus sp. MBLB4367]|uniref:ABC transporter substrate-binding protein n=1 Tax=Paenibacillus sp. MBLB4367 TaxID=3384767 RepID=UPI0039080A65